MWLGLALVVWLWGLTLYLAVYYVAGWYWHGQLYDVLGQDFYNAHIPGGGWEAALVPTIVFLATLGIVGAARRPIGAAAAWLSRRTPVPPRVGLVVCNLALIAMTVPAIHAGVVGTRAGISKTIRDAQNAEAEQRAKEERAHDPFYTGEGMQDPVAYSGSNGFGGERLIVGVDGVFRRTTWGCMGGDRLEGHFEREGDRLRFMPPPPEFKPYSPPLIRLLEVRWGSRSYLLPDDPSVMTSFCNAINSGAEPRSHPFGSVLLREGDEALPVDGLPTLPEPFGALLLAVPLEGHTIETAADGTTWVDLGSEQGIRLGMILFVPNAPAGCEWHDSFGDGRRTQPLEILEVGPARCRVRYLYAPGRKPPLPEGLAVTSKHATGD